MKSKLKYILLRMIFVVSSIVLLSGCQSNQPKMPVLYAGYNFDAMIGDAHVVELKDKSSIPALDGYVRDVNWQLDRPISGKIVAKYRPNKYTKQTIGNLRSIDGIDVIPLTRVHLSSKPAMLSDNSVLISGHAALSQVNVLKSNLLPKGDYVLRLKIRGTHNWDRKEVYVQVR